MHGAHPAEGALVYMSRDKDGNMLKGEAVVYEPVPEGEGQGPDCLTWSKTETPDYTLVEFSLSGPFKLEDLELVKPPVVDPTKPVIISGRGPGYLTQTIAASYRHYQGVPAVAFYQPASKFGPAKTEVGISHSEEYPLGLNFGEPSEIGVAKKAFEQEMEKNLESLETALSEYEVVSVERDQRSLIIQLSNGEVFALDLKNVKVSKV